MNTQKLALQKAVEIAMREGLEEEKVYDRANSIVEDSLKEEPETEEGKEVKQFVAENPVSSPYNQKKFDYAKLREDTTTIALRQTFPILAKYPSLIPPVSQETPEVRQEIEKAYNECTLELFDLLDKTGVSLQEYQYYISVLTGVIQSINDVMQAQVRGHRSEILSRLLGIKDPGNDKFDSNYATYQDLKNLLEKARESTGNRPEDYFTIG